MLKERRRPIETEKRRGWMARYIARSAAKCLWCILGMTAVIYGILSMQPDAVEAIVYCCG